MLQKLLNAFRSGARTVGLSPKALAAPIGAAITALLALVGLTPQVIGDAIGVNAPAVAAAILTVATGIATVLLPPGVVTQPPTPGTA
jgi:uncharacterized membrane protein